MPRWSEAGLELVVDGERYLAQRRNEMSPDAVESSRCSGLVGLRTIEAHRVWSMDKGGER